MLDSSAAHNSSGRLDIGVNRRVVSGTVTSAVDAHVTRNDYNVYTNNIKCLYIKNRSHKSVANVPADTTIGATNRFARSNST
jgi:hypothetical protein